MAKMARLKLLEDRKSDMEKALYAIVNLQNDILDKNANGRETQKYILLQGDYDELQAQLNDLQEKIDNASNETEKEGEEGDQ